MAHTKNTSASIDVTAAQAKYVLERAISERKISAVDVRRYLSALEEEIGALQQRLAALQSLVVEPVGRAAAKVAARVQRSAQKISRGRLQNAAGAKPGAAPTASQQLQGQYLGLLRQIAEKDRAKFQTMARDKGREQAIAAMRKALGK